MLQNIARRAATYLELGSLDQMINTAFLERSFILRSRLIVENLLNDIHNPNRILV
ncbi:MAG: hypothetical protein MUP11_13365 [Anaerolineales bacterium]|nr:hypothetical protein [Anaerolineales bacterium]